MVSTTKGNTAPVAMFWLENRTCGQYFLGIPESSGRIPLKPMNSGQLMIGGTANLCL
jgi:hypothetical protein